MNRLSSFSNRAGEIPIGGDSLQSPIKYCVHPTYALEISASGIVLYCANDSLVTQPMGDLKQQAIMEAWDAPGYAKLRSDLRKGNLDSLPQSCMSCRSTSSVGNAEIQLAEQTTSLQKIHNRYVFVSNHSIDII